MGKKSRRASLLEGLSTSGRPVVLRFLPVKRPGYPHPASPLTSGALQREQPGRSRLRVVMSSPVQSSAGIRLISLISGWGSQGEGGLVKPARSIIGAVEDPLATFTAQYGLFLPVTQENRALFRKPLDEFPHRRVAQATAVIGAEFRHDAAAALLPVGYQAGRHRGKKDEAQQVPVGVSIEPASEQAGSGCVPCPRCPSAVEYIGGNGHSPWQSENRGRKISRIPAAPRDRVCLPDRTDKTARQRRDLAPRQDGPRRTARRKRHALVPATCTMWC